MNYNSVILDPVGAGSTTLRRETVKRLLEEVQFTAIRGNASEMKAIAGVQALGRGVDVSKEDMVSEHSLQDDILVFGELARKLRCVIAVSGKIDVVTNGVHTMLIRNGCKMMARITGSGCMLTTLIGAFCGANQENIFHATSLAVGVMGIAGENADEKRRKYGTGNATFRNDLIDSVFSMTVEEIEEKINYEVFQRTDS